MNSRLMKYVRSFNRKTRNRQVQILRKMNVQGKLLPGQWETCIWGKLGAGILSYSKCHKD